MTNLTIGKRRNVATRILAVFLALGLVVLAGCGGSAGVEDGSIHGKVFGNSSGGSATDSPLSSVSVVAVREGGTPEVIRTTKTNANGEFVMTGLPTGKYVIGYVRDGFRSITTQEGNTVDRSAVGDQIRVFVEPGATSEAPDVRMVALAQDGDSTVVLTILDGVTAEPVNHATVMVGSAVTSNGGTNGVYTLSVPVILPSDAVAGTQPLASRYVISADGYNNDASSQGTIQVIANETVTQTIRLDPIRSYISGYIRIAKWDALYQKNLTLVDITCDRVERNILRAEIQPSGYFQVVVPCSNAFTTRQFTLTFSSPVLQQTIVSNIVAARALGTRQLTSPVTMNPITVDVVGTVADSSGNPPNQLNPSGLPDTVVVKETGQMANIINGAYTIPDVPTVNANVTPSELSLEVTAYNPFGTGGGGGVGTVETQTTTIKPVSDGSANPTFTVPMIRTGS